MERKVLKASDGMILTNGEIYGKIIYLAENEDEAAFKEITEEEHNEKLEDLSGLEEELQWG